MSERGTARLDDRTIGDCSIHGPNIGGTIITGSENVLTNNRPTARLSDSVQADCGHVAVITSASETELTNNRGTARLNDTVGDSPYTGVIVTASTDTFPNPG